MQALHVVVRHILGRGPFVDVERLNGGGSGAAWPRRQDLGAAVGSGERRRDAGAVCGQVGAFDDSVVLGTGRRDGCGDVAPVERLNTILGQHVERFGEFRLGDADSLHVIGLWRVAVGIEVPLQFGVTPGGGCSALHVHGVEPAEFEAFPSQFRCGEHQLAPGHAAVALVQEAQPGHGARNAHGPVAVDVCVVHHAVPEEGADVAAPVARIPVRRGAGA